LTEPDPGHFDPETVSETAESPEDVASAARSCLVILIILAALVVIGCVFAVVALFR
jgi:hypothetical protein